MSDVFQNGAPLALEASPTGSQTEQTERNGSEYLQQLGNSVRAARARRGMTRKTLARDSGVSERFLAQLESGTGNASILVLREIADALDVPLEALLPDGDRQSVDLAGAVELLRRLDDMNLARANTMLRQEFGAHSPTQRGQRVALIGLRGGGKSTIGKLLAEKLQLPFFELDRLIEQESGLSLSMIFDMYGQSGFRRFERRCLDALLQREERFVLATGGSLVSEPGTYDRLLAACYTIWLKATPQEHMSRVTAQGDMRPMAQNPEAMADLERILAERNQLYDKADVTINTSNRTVHEVLSDALESVKRFAATSSVDSMRD
jgi:XRE family aerobic/anaerobic benzoate catabolism transcriptional regulator